MHGSCMTRFNKRHGKENCFSFSINHEVLENGRLCNFSLYVNFLIVHCGIGVSPLILLLTTLTIGGNTWVLFTLNSKLLFVFHWFMHSSTLFSDEGTLPYITLQENIYFFSKYTFLKLRVLTMRFEWLSRNKIHLIQR